MDTENEELKKTKEITLCKPVYNCEQIKQKSRKQICEHGKRKSYCLLCGGSELCIHKKRKARCKECNGSEYCSHGKIKYICRDCGGSAYCEHNKIKNRCKECGGSQICIHNKIKDRCKECGGSQICIHNKLKMRCIECGGNSLCIHNIRKECCRECGGSQICIHNKNKGFCKECGGSQICIHNKIKAQCIDCHGSAFCIHNKIKIMCKECNGSACCVHGKIKYNCRDCGSSSFCEHGKNKRRCKECGGSNLCKTPLCETRYSKKYEGYCLRCFVHTYPDKPNARNYKTKEKTVVDEVLKSFPQFTWTADKKVQDGCSRRRPDMFMDMGSHAIIVEIDENQHTDYDCSCENKRLMEISQDIGHRPIVFIRFNPDQYIDESGTKVRSCFASDKTGMLIIAKTKEKEWNSRIESLKSQIQYWSENITNKTVEVIQLFFDSHVK